jgi:hypothetical protein
MIGTAIGIAVAVVVLIVWPALVISGRQSDAEERLG